MSKRTHDSKGPQRKRTRSALGEDELARVLDIAEAEFAEHGFEDASFNGIIARAGISKGSMYYRFRDKADLFAAVLARAAGVLATVVGPWQPAAHAAGYREQLSAVVLRVFAVVAHDPTMAQVVRVVARIPDALVRLTADQQEAALAWTTAVLRDGQRVGAVRSDLPVGFLASAALGLGQGMDRYMLQQLEHTDPEQLMALLAGSIDIFLRALAPP
ncbi:MAG: TetR/AcrR family transcriptional regulator [Sandaracinaceae bacterium]|nr:TetR/AcrR family transcriptional regulator [Sandaracinaceae bacterium]